MRTNSLHIVLLCCGLIITGALAAKNPLHVEPGIGIGNYGSYYFGRFTVPVELRVKSRIHDYFSVGGYGSFNTSGFGSESYRAHQVGLGVIGQFHWWSLLKDNVEGIEDDQFDLYVNLWIGGRVFFDNVPQNTFQGASRVIGGTGVGAHYAFNPKLGVWAEVGANPSSLFTLGLRFSVLPKSLN